MIVAVAMAYAPALRAALVWDDHALVEKDPRWVKASLPEIFEKPFWPTGPLVDVRTTYYRPLVLASFRFDRALGGDAQQFHFTNVFVHLVACALLAFVARRLGASGGAAVLAALVWGLAPRLTESVAWVSGRTDVFAGAFALGALALHPDVGEAPRSRLWLRTAASGTCLLAALLSKEVAVAAAIAIVVAATRPRTRERTIRAAAGVGIPLLAYFALRINALSATKEHVRELPLSVRVATSFEALGRYAAMTFDFARPRTSIGMIGETSVAYVVLGGIVVIGLLAFRSRYRVPLGMVLAIFSIAPVLHILPFNLSSAVVADRLLYLPLAGVAIALAVAARDLRPRMRTIAGGAACVVACVSAIATSARIGDYEEEERFWVVAAENAHPHNMSPRNALAGVVRDDGAHELACRLFAASNATTPARRTRENLAACWGRIGKYDESLATYDALVRDYPDVGRVFFGLAFARMQVFDWNGARQAVDRAVSLDRTLAQNADALRSTIDRVVQEAPRFATEEQRRHAPLEAAGWYARIGRGADAERLDLAVALDPNASEEARRTATRDLLLDGSLEGARTAVQATAALIGPTERRALRDREQRRAVVTRLEPRIEALAR
jgi:tetratricopeptide (TPR) repeat protein